MNKTVQFDKYLSSSSSLSSTGIITNKTIDSDNYSVHLLNQNVAHSDKDQQPIPAASIVFTAISTVSTLALIYLLTKDVKSHKLKSNVGTGKSTPLPGYGILGDKVNEIIELFLDALAVYVQNDNKWECRRRMLCEANQRAGEYGVVQGLLMYFLSLGVSFLLQNQRVSESLEAMKFGRRGSDCTQLYSCPFSL